MKRSELTSDEYIRVREAAAQRNREAVQHLHELEQALARAKQQVTTLPTQIGEAIAHRGADVVTSLRRELADAEAAVRDIPDALRVVSKQIQDAQGDMAAVELPALLDVLETFRTKYNEAAAEMVQCTRDLLALERQVRDAARRFKRGDLHAALPFEIDVSRGQVHVRGIPDLTPLAAEIFVRLQDATPA